MSLKNAECDREVVELLRTMQRGVSKHGTKGFIHRIKEIDIKDTYQDYIEVRDYIINETCKLLNVSKDKLIGKSTRGVVTTARKVAVSVIKFHFDVSDEELAKYFDGRTRQVIYNIMKECKNMSRDSKYDVTTYFCHFDLINEKTEAFKKTLKK